MKSGTLFKPYFKTQRLLLRPFTRQDFTALYPIYSNLEVMRYIEAGAKTEKEVLAELNGYIKHWKEHGFGPFAVIHKEIGTLIGRSGLYLSDRSAFAQLGFVLDLPYQGQGFGTEVAKAVLAYGFKELELERIVAFAMPENLPSRRILGEKLGMHCITENFNYSQRRYAFYSISHAEYLAQV